MEQPGPCYGSMLPSCHKTGRMMRDTGVECSTLDAWMSARDRRTALKQVRGCLEHYRAMCNSSAHCGVCGAIKAVKEQHPTAIARFAFFSFYQKTCMRALGRTGAKEPRFTSTTTRMPSRSLSSRTSEMPAGGRAQSVSASAYALRRCGPGACDAAIAPLSSLSSPTQARLTQQAAPGMRRAGLTHARGLPPGARRARHARRPDTRARR